MIPFAVRHNELPAHPNRILALIVIAQFLCISLWFAGNSVIDDLIAAFTLSAEAVGHLTTSVQLGFIAGTFGFALLGLADRYSPSVVFCCSAIAAGLASSLMLLSEGQAWIIYGSRFLTGVFLAGVYPVGMKIAADYFSRDLGKALGFLVGALVLGTAFPHALKYVQTGLPWKAVMLTTTGLSMAGGLMILFFVPDGPYRVAGRSYASPAFFKAFRSGPFRTAAFGYFGHMWEVYAFWAFVPYLLSATIPLTTGQQHVISLYSFFIIGIGALGCVQGGYMARYFGSYRVAMGSLILSGMCCVVSPLVFSLSTFPILVFLLFWGVVVILDSPQFSTLVAGAVASEYRGSALTAVTGIGFGITVISIQLLTWLMPVIPAAFLFWLLIPGPVMGVIAMARMEEIKN